MNPFKDWIDINEIKPNPVVVLKELIVYTPSYGFSCTAWWCKQRECFFTSPEWDAERVPNVTHWMELPLPPQKNNKPVE